ASRPPPRDPPRRRTRAARPPPGAPAGAPRGRPADPGERMLTVNPGVFWGAGPQTAEPHGFGELGAEVTINLGENDRSHYEDDFFVYPQRGVGASLGWSAEIGRASCREEG